MSAPLPGGDERVNDFLLSPSKPIVEAAKPRPRFESHLFPKNLWLVPGVRDWMESMGIKPEDDTRLFMTLQVTHDEARKRSAAARVSQKQAQLDRRKRIEENRIRLEAERALAAAREPIDQGQAQIQPFPQQPLPALLAPKEEPVEESQAQTQAQEEQHQVKAEAQVEAQSQPVVAPTYNAQRYNYFAGSIHSQGYMPIGEFCRRQRRQERRHREQHRVEETEDQRADREFEEYCARRDAEAAREARRG
ncbi:hypothetical protein NPX13_g3603 [Xylaria arbuscula]|uniref:Uncharacterized protein n=1 Tax=Xylaria arbuscula TaxID=114810 RepID=A0A9W8NHX9_9PEZI|nr:hypothetical protein NPX13_g3603 [Xylaria arbuscula]